MKRSILIRLRTAIFSLLMLAVAVPAFSTHKQDADDKIKTKVKHTTHKVKTAVKEEKKEEKAEEKAEDKAEKNAKKHHHRHHHKKATMTTTKP